MALDRKLVRPAVPFKWTRRDVVLEALGLVVLIGYWLVLYQGFLTLADNIPILFDAKGNAAAYGPKSFHWGAPKVATALYVLMSIVAFFPRYFNYGVVEITAENAEQKYRSAATFVRYLKLIVLIVFMVASLMML